MKTYKAQFIGREVNAIGIFYPITATVQGTCEHDATIRLYDKYDHIQRLKLEEVNPPLTAYKITTDKGVSWSTNMAAGVTLEDAQKYFIGNRFNVGAFPIEDMQTAVKVEKLD